jgi:hypothetical protein
VTSALEGLTLELDGMRVESSLEGRSVTLTFIGVAELNVVDGLESLLGSLHERADTLEIEQVVVDFSQLEFMSASCLRSFISWINQLQGLPSSKQYRIRFLANPDQPWQRRSVHALKCFATELISIGSRAS